ncbi:MAG TPA: hypothetical protein VL443_00160 [Cyclobacteriaceae bacterium]|jgi:hypothetical protein|nr:hypothetical protein [Cyclobacteriaceae bacterium]
MSIIPMKFKKLKSTFRVSIVSISVVLVTMLSCKDELIETKVNSKTDTGGANALSKTATVAIPDPLLDTAELVTILGSRLPNPYLIDNMKAAYLKIKGTSAGVTVNNLYVRFAPTSNDQLVTLQEILDLELTDVPMDYKIIQHGEYYQDPSIPDEQITYQYAVVPPTFAFPAGIPYTILAQIHIPSDTNVEAAAEQLAGLNADGDDLATGGGGGGVVANSVATPMVAQCAANYHWDYSIGKCVADACDDGMHYDTSLGKCVADPSPPQPPGLPPAGTITVWDTQLNAFAGVKNVRVVAKRWFKIERMTTDALGRFTATKRFRNKVKVVVKFKNGDSVIRGIRGARLWKMLLPLQHVFGPISGSEINTYQHKFNYFTGIKTLGNQLWNAATINNSVQEYKGYAAQLKIGSLPGKIKIFITGNKKFGEGSSSTPMFAKRQVYDINVPFYKTYGVNYSDIVVSSLAGVLAGELDMIVGYYWENSDHSNAMTSDLQAETIYHELTHAAHYNKLGNTWYTEFVNAELLEMKVYSGGHTSPYGPGDNSVSPIIALGEGWAYHMGHYMADIKYGVNASCQSEQPKVAYSCASNGTGHPHIDALEAFDPTTSEDVFHWIPKGLMMDLMDDTPGEIRPTFPVDDLVSGYTNQQFFNALDSDVRTVIDFKNRLLSENGNNQSIQVNTLFGDYGY